LPIWRNRNRWECRRERGRQGEGRLFPSFQNYIFKNVTLSVQGFLLNVADGSFVPLDCFQDEENGNSGN